jgi:hypothetical protein
MAGGGTVTDVSTSAQMSAYENIFGPAARDIKFDPHRNKRHQRWHLPDALRGPNTFLTDLIDGLITDTASSPFTKTILPYLYVDQPDRKIKWNVYSFDEGEASRVPYEAAARVLPQSKRTFSGYAVRQGLAIDMEHNFMMSPAGMDNFRKQLQQLVGSIQMTNDLDVHMALLYAPSYQKQVDEKYYDACLTYMVQAHALGSSSSVRFNRVAKRGTTGDGGVRPVYRQPGGGQLHRDSAELTHDASPYAPRLDMIRWGSPLV